MREKIRKKLNSSEGISVLMGLLLFLIASILSAVMLSAALTAVKSVTSDQKVEQNYLTCSSAATTLRDAISNTKVIKTEKVTTKNKTSSSEITWSTESTGSETETTEEGFGEKYLKDWIKDLVDSSIDNKKETHTISIQGTKDMDPVEATVTIQADKDDSTAIGNNAYQSYNIEIVFATGKGADSCQMTLTLQGGCKKDTTSSTNVETTTLTYSWYGANIINGANSGEDGS